jgi:hypothetical protein
LCLVNVCHRVLLISITSEGSEVTKLFRVVGAAADNLCHKASCSGW